MRDIQWRVGRKTRRTLYRVTGLDPWADQLIGYMDSAQDAALAVWAVNAGKFYYQESPVTGNQLILTTRGGFYEDDEPVENVEAAFDAGRHIVTAPPDRDALFAFAAWCLDLDTPGSVERQSVTLTQIIARARMALGLDQEQH